MSPQALSLGLPRTVLGSPQGAASFWVGVAALRRLLLLLFLFLKNSFLTTVGTLMGSSWSLDDGWGCSPL